MGEMEENSENTKGEKTMRVLTFDVVCFWQLRTTSLGSKNVEKEQCPAQSVVGSKLGSWKTTTMMMMMMMIFSVGVDPNKR
jgi:hypothetical protein